MSSRISFNQISNRILDRLFANYSKLEDIQTELSTGKKVNKQSDDPVAASQSMELRAEVDQFTTFQRNIDDGQAYLGTVDSTLMTSNNLYQSLRESAIQASNDTNSAESRYYIGQQVRGVFDQMLALSNTNFKGDFVFSGTNSQVPPYEMRNGTSNVINAPAPLSSDMGLTGATLNTPLQVIDKNVDDSNDTASRAANAKLLVPGTVKINGLKEDTDYSVDYVHGTVTFLTAAASTMASTGGIKMDYNWVRRNEKDLDGIANREIEEGVTARINTTASEVYGAPTDDNSAWATMINLMNGTINNKPADINKSVGQIDMSLRRQLTAQAANGARINRFESTQARNDNRIVYTTELQSNVEDVDFAKAASDFNLQQTVYEASLKMGAQALQNSLVNFL